MKKRKELPRKRRRFIKKIIFLSSVLSVFVIILIGVGFYFLLLKLQKPLYISPLSAAQVAQADQGNKAQRQIENDLRKAHIEYASITTSSDSVVVSLQDKSTVTFSTQKDIMTQIASLQYILSHLTMEEGRQFSSLDLRFDQPVIVLKP